MKVYPEAQVQTLVDCWPGQLVRSLEYGPKDRVGVVFDAKNGELRGIVTLTGEFPTFFVENHPEDFNVLAYTGEGLCCTNRLTVRVPLSPDGLMLWLQ